MTYLLDTHVLIAVIEERVTDLPESLRSILTSDDNDFAVSAASLWEIAIKVRIGKLRMTLPIALVPDAARAAGWRTLSIDERHAVASLDHEPQTRDPFDRMLLAQCAVEGMRLVTVDRALVDHPLAARAR